MGILLPNTLLYIETTQFYIRDKSDFEEGENKHFAVSVFLAAQWLLDGIP